MVEYFKMDYVKGGTSQKYTKLVQCYSQMAFERFCIGNDIIVERKTPINYATYLTGKKATKQQVFSGMEIMTQ